MLQIMRVTRPRPRPSERKFVCAVLVWRYWATCQISSARNCLARSTMYLPYALFSSTCLGQKSYYACAVSRDLRVGGQKLPQIWNPRPHIASSLDHFQGATVMIKGSLLVSIPIVKRFLVENFLSPETHTFGSVFRAPWKNPWTDIRKIYGQLLPSQALRPAIFGAKVLLAVSKITH